MNERDEIGPGDDPDIFNALAKLRGIVPPEASKIRNRAAVNEALRALASEEAQPSRPASWWRRSISVPVPVAACLLLIMSLLVASKFHFRSEPPQTIPGTQAIPTAAPPAGAPADNNPLVFRETATYVCGIGELQSTRGFFFREQNR